MSDYDSNMHDQGDDENESSAWEEMMRGIIGPEATNEIAKALRARGIDPTPMLNSGNFPGSAGAMRSMMAQFNHMMSLSSGPINWKMAHDIAKTRAWGDGDLQISAAEGQRIRQALQVGDLWLDAVTDLEPARGDRHAWRRSDWVENTLDTWKQMVEPVAVNAARALSDALKAQMEEMTNHGIGELPEGLSAMFGQTQPIVEKLSAAVFAGQIGEALGGLSHEAFGSTDAGIPLTASGTTALVVPNVNAFAEGFDIPTDEVYQFVALREVAHARLFNSVSWLKAELLQSVQKYASEIRIDTEAIQDAAMSIDPTDMAALQEAMTGGAFAAETTPAQEQALENLETQLALVEGWVDVITLEAGRAYLPHIEQLRELMRRRRVSGGAAEQMLEKLIGLKLRPRQARNAAKLWEIVTKERGREERDALWNHPDFAPNAEELQDPEGFLAAREKKAEADAEIDAALEQLLDGTLGWADGLEPGQDSEGDARRVDASDSSNDSSSEDEKKSDDDSAGEDNKE
ncbi:MAG: zinc-dependent metalloprotease [Actinomycetaceae bacterium]|nr:zinc-dependent metalloprotease [Actinomycetaceae bacterium]